MKDWTLEEIFICVSSYLHCFSNKKSILLFSLNLHQ